MAAVEQLRKNEVASDTASEGRKGQEVDGRFKFVRYERSSEVKRVSDSSVSYASAFAVL